MLRELHKHKWRWYILATLIVATYPIVVSFTILSSSLSNLLAGTSDLESAKSLMVSNPTEAQNYFTSAQGELNQSITLLQDAPWYTQLLTPLPPFRWQVRLIKATHALAESGLLASSLAKDFPPLPKSTDPSTLLSQTSSNFFTWYNANTTSIQGLGAQLNEANQELQDVPNWIIPGKTATLYNLKNDVQKISSLFGQVNNLATNAQVAFGSKDSNPHTFLILFQNENELRMSGGFFGSFATLTASSGTIRQYTFGKNIYQVDAPYSTSGNAPLPPPQLATIGTQWLFRDSNVGEPGFIKDYSPHIADSYTAETNQPIDGIIYIGVSVLEDALAVTGPLDIPDVGVINATDASTILNKYIDDDYYYTEANREADQPKSILNTMTPLILQKVMTQPHGLESLIPKLGASVAAKNIQFWSRNSALESTLTDFLPVDSPQPGNWLKIVQNNLGGKKSSRAVSQQVTLQSHTNLFQSLTNYDVTITRKYPAAGATPGADNLNYSEIYLPAAAKITSLPQNNGGESQLPIAQQQALGTYNKVWQATETDTANWKRISFWSSTAIGETTTYTFSYTLPNDDAYGQNLLYLKEAGSSNETLTVDGTTYTVASNITAPL